MPKFVLGSFENRAPEVKDTLPVNVDKLGITETANQSR